ncbi:hypothetical protein OCU04_004093 [Sclerotinia nivalis]|uniref:Sexual development protein n=1 Tax=Sclerotinia nivalis TaxID=352851 RepID=A0A9X0AU68_9HELO|nr:hypothetical protein OCU04_004093 [Sclerotinia nivalis]
MLLSSILALGVTTVLATPTCTSGSTLYLSPVTTAALQLALYLENLEVNLFQSASANITSVDTIQGISNKTLDAIKKAALQEEAHQTTLQNILVATGASIIPQCQYVFPSRNTSEFLSLGRSLGSVGLSATLTLAETVAPLDSNLVAGIASIAAAKARNAAFLNIANGYLPNLAPFDTPISLTWAYNLALNFTVPASCSVELPIPILPTLSTQSILQSNQTSLKFLWDPMQKPVIQENGKDLFIGWVNQLGPPVYTPLKSISNGTGTATIPPGLKGVVYTTLTTQNTLVSLDDLTGATLAGPAIVLVD